jgi:hypothetical protein
VKRDIEVFITHHVSRIMRHVINKVLYDEHQMINTEYKLKGYFIFATLSTKKFWVQKFLSVSFDQTFLFKRKVWG